MSITHRVATGHAGAGTLVKGAGAATAGWASDTVCDDDTKRKEL